jgi:hypothetical protein
LFEAGDEPLDQMVLFMSFAVAFDRRCPINSTGNHAMASASFSINLSCQTAAAGTEARLLIPGAAPRQKLPEKTSSCNPQKKLE